MTVKGVTHFDAEESKVCHWGAHIQAAIARANKHLHVILASQYSPTGLTETVQKPTTRTTIQDLSLSSTASELVHKFDLQLFQDADCLKTTRGKNNNSNNNNNNNQKWPCGH